VNGKANPGDLLICKSSIDVALDMPSIFSIGLPVYVWKIGGGPCTAAMQAER